MLQWREIKLKLVFFLMFMVAFSFCSCKDNEKQKEIAGVVNEWIGKEIQFPESVPCFVLGKDTISECCDEIFFKEYKILSYIDSAGCNICKLDLFEWEQVIKEAGKLFPDKVGFLLFFQPNNVEETADWILRNRFNHPVFMDTIGSINRLNRFPQMMQHQCYLLGKDNKVLAVGNPASNIQVWELYKKIIANEKKTEH
jgi:hypothetical protein